MLDFLVPLPMPSQDVKNIPPIYSVRKPGIDFFPCRRTDCLCLFLRYWGKFSDNPAGVLSPFLCFNEVKEFTEVVKECGFTGLEGVSYTGNGIEILEDYVYNTLNYKERTFTDDNVICRKLFGLYNGESISDYYISIKPENIYEIARVTE